MLGLIIRKEILSNILSLRFGVTFLLFIVLIFTSIYVTANEHKMEISRYGSRVRLYNERLADIMAEDRDWGSHGRLRRLFDNEGKSDAVSAVIATNLVLSKANAFVTNSSINTTNTQMWGGIEPFMMIWVG